MEKKTEKLPVSLVNKIKDLQKTGNDEIITLGRIDIDINILEKEIQKLQKMKTESLDKYSKVVADMNSELRFLEDKYPKGEINLDEGTIIFEGE